MASTYASTNLIQSWALSPLQAIVVQENDILNLSKHGWSARYTIRRISGRALCDISQPLPTGGIERGSPQKPSAVIIVPVESGSSSDLGVEYDGHTSSWIPLSNITIVPPPIGPGPEGRPLITLPPWRQCVPIG